MPCVIADLRLSRRPVSVKIAVCSLFMQGLNHINSPSQTAFPTTPCLTSLEPPGLLIGKRGNDMEIPLRVIQPAFMKTRSIATKNSNKSEHFYTHTVCTKIQTHYFSYTDSNQLWDPHLVPHLEQAPVKWGPVWEMLAGLMETAKVWSRWR